MPHLFGCTPHSPPSLTPTPLSFPSSLTTPSLLCSRSQVRNSGGTLEVDVEYYLANQVGCLFVFPTLHASFWFLPILPYDISIAPQLGAAVGCRAMGPACPGAVG